MLHFSPLVDHFSRRNPSGGSASDVSGEALAKTRLPLEARVRWARSILREGKKVEPTHAQLSRMLRVPLSSLRPRNPAKPKEPPSTLEALWDKSNVPARQDMLLSRVLLRLPE